VGIFVGVIDGAAMGGLVGVAVVGAPVGLAVGLGGDKIKLLVTLTGDCDVAQPAHTETAAPFVGMTSVCASE
jgi:hypothetical protein